MINTTSRSVTQKCKHANNKNFTTPWVSLWAPSNHKKATRQFFFYQSNSPTFYPFWHRDSWILRSKLAWNIFHAYFPFQWSCVSIPSATAAIAEKAEKHRFHVASALPQDGVQLKSAIAKRLICTSARFSMVGVHTSLAQWSSRSFLVEL